MIKLKIITLNVKMSSLILQVNHKYFNKMIMKDTDLILMAVFYFISFRLRRRLEYMRLLYLKLVKILFLN
jgi:hypothetical protein